MISGSATAPWRGATLDSRQVSGGELFFALAGERTDGHRFVAQALERGAAAAIVQQKVEIQAGGAAIRVPDTLAALHRLTREVRTREPRKLVAITGSVGKTTTKELLAAMLAQRFRVARNPRSLNNLLGFPVALLGIPEGTEWMVAEMGMSTPGELRQVSWLGKPDVAVFTNVRPVHLQAFGSLEAIREAKAELLDGLADEAWWWPTKTIHRSWRSLVGTQAMSSGSGDSRPRTSGSRRWRASPMPGSEPDSSW